MWIHGPSYIINIMQKPLDFGSGQRGGNEVSSPNGLARERLNLRSMNSGGWVDMSVYRYSGGYVDMILHYKHNVKTS